MKVSARFPVKAFPFLIGIILLIHFLLLAIMLVEIKILWQQGVIAGCLLLSTYFSIGYYQKITTAPDDLCWNGESWLIHLNQKQKNAIYLTLEADSWMSSQLSLLHLTHGCEHYYWLFSRYSLGDRMYSELTYLVRENIAAHLKNKSDKREL